MTYLTRQMTRLAEQISRNAIRLYHQTTPLSWLVPGNTSHCSKEKVQKGERVVLWTSNLWLGWGTMSPPNIEGSGKPWISKCGRPARVIPSTWGFADGLTNIHSLLWSVAQGLGLVWWLGSVPSIEEMLECITHIEKYEKNTYQIND